MTSGKHPDSHRCSTHGQVKDSRSANFNFIKKRTVNSKKQLSISPFHESKIYWWVTWFSYVICTLSNTKKNLPVRWTPWVEIPTLFLQVSDEVAKAIVGKFRQPSGRGAGSTRVGYVVGFNEGRGVKLGLRTPLLPPQYMKKKEVSYIYIYQLLVIC